MEPTREEIRVAILKSISKWKSIQKGNKSDKGASNCALCKLFNTDENYYKANECIDCPVYLYTGFSYCENTPHEDWLKHHLAQHEKTFNPEKGRFIVCDQCKTLAWNEIVFLREVLENWKKSQGMEEPKPCCCSPTKIIKIRITAS
jgi:hypothetical protein